MVVRLTDEISEFQKAWRNDPAIHRWTRQNGIITDANMMEWESRIANDPSIKMFGIIAEEENVGTCGLTSISLIHGSAEFSLFIGPEYQGNGYGKAALKELIAYGFNHLRLNCIWGETLEGNPALKMFLDVGMKEEGRLRQRYFKNGQYQDSIIVSILAQDFRLRDKKWN